MLPTHLDMRNSGRYLHSNILSSIESSTIDMDNSNTTPRSNNNNNDCINSVNVRHHHHHHHHHHRKHCTLRNLNLISLCFGLAAVGCLSLATSTDFWLYTNEPVRTTNDSLDYSFHHHHHHHYHHHHQKQFLPRSGKGKISYFNSDDDAEDDDDDDDDDDDVDDDSDNTSDELEVTTSENEMMVMQIRIHSGLWRACIMHDDPGEDVPPESCYNIGYFSQSWERLEDTETTLSILRAIRRSSPFVVSSLFLLLISLAVSIVGQNKNDLKIISGALIYIFSGLVLAMGVILYISSVNDEVSHRKKTETDPSNTFTYHYGWAFFFGAASFLCAMIAAVSNISIYISNQSHGANPCGLNNRDKRPIMDSSASSNRLTEESSSTQTVKEAGRQRDNENVRVVYSSFIL